MSDSRDSPKMRFLAAALPDSGTRFPFMVVWKESIDYSASAGAVLLAFHPSFWFDSIAVIGAGTTSSYFKLKDSQSVTMRNLQLSHSTAVGAESPSE